MLLLLHLKDAAIVHFTFIHNMTQAFIDQTITAVDSLCWVDARSETTYIEHILPNIAVLDDVTDGSDY
jgi:hypothetical protein